MTTIQLSILGFIEEDDIDYKEFNDFLNTIVKSCEPIFFEVLHLLLQIANNHHHTKNFFTKIEYILRYFKKKLKEVFSNNGIFSFFESNKRILLFLIEEGIMVMDEQIAHSIQYKMENFEKLDEIYIEENETNIKFLYYYFYPELRTFIDYKNYELPEESIEIFNQKRKNGENDGYICQLIRNDSEIDFIDYVQINKINIFSSIKPSIYETNSFLLTENTTSLIEYAAFFGSVNIFKYLLDEGCCLDRSIIKYAVYSNNKEMVELILNKLSINTEYFLEDLIKTHHIDLLEIDDKYLEDCVLTIFQSFNYKILPTKFYTLKEDEEDIVMSYCFFDYPQMFRILLNNRNIYSDTKFFVNQFDYLSLFVFMSVFRGNYGITKFLLEESYIEITKRDMYFLLFCIIFNRLEILELLLKHDLFNVNYICEDDNLAKIPLIAAIECNSIGMAKLFLQQKDVNVNIHVENKMLPPIFAAIDNDNTEFLQLLLERDDIDVNEIVKDGIDEYTPLSYAFHNKRKKAFYFLVNHPKVDIKMQIENDESIIIKAIDYEDIEIIQYLLNNPNMNVNQKCKFDKDYSEEYPLFFYAMLSNNDEIINLFVKHPTFDFNAIVTINNFNFSFLTLAFCFEKNEIVKYILQNKLIDLKINEKITVFDQQISSRLLCSKFNVCHGYSTYLVLAIDLGDIEIIKLILEYPDIDVNSGIEFCYKIENQSKFQRYTPLYFAIENNMAEVVELLLQFPQIDVNIKSSKYKKGVEDTSLICAIENKNIQIIKKLLENDNIDVNLKRSYNGEEGETPLMAAILINDIQIIQLLLSHSNIDVNLKSKNRYKEHLSDEEMTPLQYVVINNCIDIIRLLISAPTIDINMILNYEWNKTMYETTALGIAILNSNIEITHLLLNHKNIDINSKIKTDVIETYPITLAAQIGNINIVNLLLANQSLNVNNYHSYLQIKSKDHYILEKMTALHIAVANNNYEIAEILLNHPKIDVNIKAISREISQTIYISKEKTALHMAAKKFFRSFTKLLLSHPEIDITCKDENDLTPEDLTNNWFHKRLFHK